jgi:hypothetical protein
MMVGSRPAKDYYFLLLLLFILSEMGFYTVAAVLQ